MRGIVLVTPFSCSRALAWAEPRQVYGAPHRCAADSQSAWVTGQIVTGRGIHISE